MLRKIRPESSTRGWRARIADTVSLQSIKFESETKLKPAPRQALYPPKTQGCLVNSAMAFLFGRQFPDPKNPPARPFPAAVRASFTRWRILSESIPQRKAGNPTGRENRDADLQ